jgi:hypothetical protein
VTVLSNSPWLPWSLLLGLSLLARTLHGSWLAPSAFVGLMWTVCSGLPLVATGDHISPQCIWVLLGFIACFQVGTFVLIEPAAQKYTDVPWNQIGLAAIGDRCLRFSLGFAAAAFVGAVIYTAIWLRNLGLSFSLNGFLGLGSLMYDIIVGGEPDPWWYRLLRMWVFPSVLLGGFAAPLVRSRTKKLLTLGGFVPSLLMGTAIASRFATLIAIAAWMSGYLSMKCFLSRGRFRVTPKFAGGLLSIALAAVTMFVALYAVRGRISDNASDASVKISSDILAYLAVFDRYVNSDEPHSLAFGAYTAGGIFEFLGIKSRIRNLNWAPIDLEGGISSNIYTAFRGLIDDFSLSGSMVLCLLAGALVGRAHGQLCNGRVSLLWVLAAYYAFVLFSPIVSAFYYNSIPLALFVGALVLRRSKVSLLPRPRIFVPTERPVG